MKKAIEACMEHAEECIKECSKKQDWTSQDIECAKNAAELYSSLLGIKMSLGIYDDIKPSYDTSGARMPRVYYGPDMSYMRGRDAATGRYMSRGDETSGRYYDYRIHGTSNAAHKSVNSVKDRAVGTLEDMLGTAQTEHERQKIMEFIGMIENSDT